MSQELLGNGLVVHLQLFLILLFNCFSHNASKLVHVLLCSRPADVYAHHARMKPTSIKLVTENGSVIDWSDMRRIDTTIYRRFLYEGYQSPVYGWHEKSWYSFLTPLLPGIHKLRLDGYISNVGDTVAIDDIRIDNCKLIGRSIDITLTSDVSISMQRA